MQLMSFLTNLRFCFESHHLNIYLKNNFFLGMNIKAEVLEKFISENNLPSFAEIDLLIIKSENRKEDAKKQKIKQRREKRLNLSEEEKEKVKEKKREWRKKRLNQSEEEKEKVKEKKRECMRKKRLNLSEEEKEKVRKKIKEKRLNQSEEEKEKVLEKQRECDRKCR